ncbi:hypothetical protein AURDEDRAFT_164150 [Auricularia subglabra TFB-10046 SS5]|nr:hypothetical protein AURDEDRAFT_164150 [Auricularia subglabra TFB-10046 SS5]
MQRRTQLRPGTRAAHPANVFAVARSSGVAVAASNLEHRTIDPEPSFACTPSRPHLAKLEQRLGLTNGSPSDAEQAVLLWPDALDDSAQSEPRIPQRLRAATNNPVLLTHAREVLQTLEPGDALAALLPYFGPIAAAELVLAWLYDERDRLSDAPAVAS